MSILNNPRDINPQDFPEETQQTVEKLAYIINPFMQEVVNLSNKNIGFENLSFNLISISIEVDSSGKPLQVNKMNVGNMTNPKGTIIIDAINLTNAANISNQAPFLYFTSTGTNFVTINKIVGLIPNNKYQLNIIVF